jgi:hypothetical protein
MRFLDAKPAKILQQERGSALSEYLPILNAIREGKIVEVMLGQDVKTYSDAAFRQYIGSYLNREGHGAHYRSTSAGVVVVWYEKKKRVYPPVKSEKAKARDAIREAFKFP